MKAKDEIQHDGIIAEVTPEYISVEIVASSACSSCHAKSLCGMAEEEHKLLMLPADPYAEWAPGDRVLVCTKKSMGLKAVWISYVIPLAILMILILSLSPVVGSEPLTGLAAIAGVAVYYLLVWCFRDKLANEFVFYIKKEK